MNVDKYHRDTIRAGGIAALIVLPFYLWLGYKLFSIVIDTL